MGASYYDSVPQYQEYSMQNMRATNEARYQHADACSIVTLCFRRLDAFVNISKTNTYQ